MNEGVLTQLRVSCETPYTPAQFVCDLISTAVAVCDEDTASTTAAFKEQSILLTDKKLMNTVLYPCYDNDIEVIEYELCCWVCNILRGKCAL